MFRPLVLLVFAALASAGGTAGAQTSARPTARSMYEEAFAREHVLRGDLAARSGDPALVAQLRGVVSAYEEIVRRFPTNGYCDNALWQAAGLAREAVQRWNQDRDRRAFVRFLRWLVSEYPGSPFVPQARDELATLETVATAPPPPSPPAPPGRAPESRPVSRPASSAPVADAIAELRSIRRTVLPDVVRVTIEFDHEVSYSKERLDNPARVVFDFSRSKPSTTTVEGLLTDADDVVRQIRVGVRPDQTTRVVIDLVGVSGYSVFELYNPYRLVVDCARVPAKVAVSVTPSVTPARPVPRPVLVSASWGPIYLGLAGAAATTALAHDLDRTSEHAMTREATAPPPARASDPAPPASRTVEKPMPPASNIGGGLSLARQLCLGVSRIVIDPGHGGHDPGAEATGVSEAAVVLDVALRLEKLLLAEPGTDVVLTRRTDAYVSLDERTAIANRAQADLFLSVHANANRSRAVGGVETYYLNFANSPAAASVAARENAAAGMSMGSLPDIVKTIALSSKTNESRDFATMVQESMVRRLTGVDTSLKDLGVKQAPFVVLIGAAMPSVLVEISFITNGQESRLLRNAAYRQRIAEALADGVRRYQKTLKTGRPVQPQ